MSLFDSHLKDSESLFKDETPLDHDYVPHKIQFRENESEYIAEVIKPLLKKRNSRNLFITGSPGIGKTLVVDHIFREMKDNGMDEEVYPIFINCWQKDSAHKVVLEICQQLGFYYTVNKTTDQLLQEIARRINEKAAVIALDEIDKLDKESLSIIYSLLELLYRRSLLLITNNKHFISELDSRITSRLLPETLEFRSYSLDETKEVLKRRVESAFVPGVFSSAALDIVAEKAYSLKDLRVGLFLLREAGNEAERKFKRNVSEEDAKTAIVKLPEYKIVSSDNLNDGLGILLEVIKNNSGKTSKEIYEISKLDTSYRTFLRKLNDLEKTKDIHIREESHGDGKKSFVYFGSVENLKSL